jgi:hypothetical protein
VASMHTVVLSGTAGYSILMAFAPMVNWNYSNMGANSCLLLNSSSPARTGNGTLPFLSRSKQEAASGLQMFGHLHCQLCAFRKGMLFPTKPGLGLICPELYFPVARGTQPEKEKSLHSL